MEHNASPPSQSLHSLRDRVVALRDSVSQALPDSTLPAELEVILGTTTFQSVGFIGARGTGKTTLLNQFLGGDELLPTGDFSHTTAAITEVFGWDRPFYSATVYFVRWEEWVADWAEYVSMVNSRNEPDANSDESVIDAFLTKLVKLWGNEEIPDEQISVESSLPPDALELLHRGYMSVNASSRTNFVKQLSLFNHYDERFWPIVSHIVVCGPFPKLVSSGMSLLDIPGQDRESPSMYERYEEGIKRCSRLFILLEEKKIEDTVLSTWRDLDLWDHPEGCSVSYLLTGCHRLGTKLAKRYGGDPNQPKTIAQKMKDSFLKAVKQRRYNEKDFNVVLLESVDGGVFAKETEEFMHRLIEAVTTHNTLAVERLKDRLETHVSLYLDRLTVASRAFKDISEVGLDVVIRETVLRVGQILSEDANTSSPEGEFVPWLSDIHYSQAQCVYKRKMAHYGPYDISKALVCHWLQNKKDYAAIFKKIFLECLTQKLQSYEEPSTQRLFSYIKLQVNAMPITLLQTLVQSTYSPFGNALWNQKPAITGRGCLQRMRSNMKSFCNTKISQFPSDLAKEACESTGKVLKQFLKRIVSTQMLSPDATLGPFLQGFLRGQQPDFLVPVTLGEIDFEGVNDTAVITSAGDLTRLDPKLHPCEVKFHNLRKQKKGFTYGDVPTRVKKLSSATGVPMPFEIQHTWETYQPSKVEQFLHEIFEHFRPNQKREFFEAPLKLLIKVGDWLVHLANTN